MAQGKDTLNFPEDFMFGVGSSAYQIEGSPRADGKGESVQDTFLQTRAADTVVDKTNGDVACDSYKLYKEDTKLLTYLGVQYYRFSISWCRILPTADITKISQAGIEHYNKVIDDLLENGIQPMVTMFHWDLPQALQDLGGWPNHVIANYFEDYARILFTNFGDRVKWWCTINEPRLYSAFAYGRSLPVYPVFAPGIEMPGIADYLACHTMLLAHAKAYHLYNRSFRDTQKGQIGIVADAFNYRPATNNKQDTEAAERGLIFETLIPRPIVPGPDVTPATPSSGKENFYMCEIIGWVLHPIFSKEGGYPPLMKERVDRNSIAEGRFHSRLPSFTQDEIKLLKGSADFLGVNHYTTYLAADGECGAAPSHNRDTGFIRYIDPNSGTRYPGWLPVVPDGLREILCWIKKNYGNPKVLITENGCADVNPFEDIHKTHYHRLYLEQLLKAITEDGCNVIAYTAWSLMDSYEWDCGYTEKFGLFHVDFSDPQRPRTPKMSANFYKKVIELRSIPQEQ